MLDLVLQQVHAMTLSTIPAATAPYRHHGRLFSIAALAIVAASIEERLSYNSEVEAFCKDRWMALHPARPMCVTGADATPWVVAAPAEGGARLEQRKALIAQLATLPRGAYGRIRTDWHDADGPRTSWDCFVSEGDGGVYDVRNSGDAMPTFERMYGALVGFEIYLCRQGEEQRRREERSRQLTAERGWRVGKKIMNIALGRERYSSGTITNVLENGYLTLELAKRRHTQRWTWTGPAQHITLPDPKADEGIALLVDAVSGKTLFAAAA